MLKKRLYKYTREKVRTLFHMKNCRYSLSKLIIYFDFLGVPMKARNKIKILNLIVIKNYFAFPVKTSLALANLDSRSAN